MKKSNLKLFLFILILSFAHTSHSQVRCGVDRDHQEKLNDPEYRNFLKQIRSEIERIKGKDFRIDCTAGTITFPVAIHYNWTGIGSVVDQCMIDAANNSIDALNDDFLALNADLSNFENLTATCNTYYPASAKSTGSCINFCIAQYDHPGCSGLCDNDLAITAGQFSYPNTGGCFSDYINIFVQAGTGQLGIAPIFGVTVLGGNGPQVDASVWGGPGVLCTPNGLGNTFNSNSSYNLGRTLTHEMGHYFGLQHLFVGDCTIDDGYSDTPDQSQENFGKPVVINCNPADNGNTANNTCSTLDMWCSYMDYSDDTHLFMFTTMQSDEMYASAQTSPISDSAVKCTGGTAVPTADITLDNLPIFCTNDSPPYNINFEDNSSRCPTSWTWTFSGAGVSPTTSSLENPVVTVNATGDITVTLISSNAVGSSTMVTKTYYVSIALPGSCPDCGPKLYDSGGPNNDYGPNEALTWTYCAGAGEVLNLSVSGVDLPDGLFTDVVHIYEGTTLPADLNTYVALLGENNGSAGGFWQPNGSGGVSYIGSSFQSVTNCLTFYFLSNSTNEGTGWNMDLGCCDPGNTDPECVGNNPGSGFNTTISSYCNTKTVFDLGDFRNDDEVFSSRACGLVSYSNNSFYQITCNANGGLLSVDVSTNLDNGGLVDAYLMGPVTGTCPNYTSGELSIADCATADSGTISLSEPGVAPNSKFFIFINSEFPGTFNVESTGPASGNALPIELVEFSAKENENGVLLSWETQIEINNDYFTIEKSKDGHSYEVLEEVLSLGNTANGHNYEYLDKDAFSRITYYRLSQTDLDGTTSIVGYAHIKREQKHLDFKIFPNPSTTNELNLMNLSPDRTFMINIVNELGEQLKLEVVSDKYGSTKLDVSSLPAGLFFISISDGINIQVSKYVRI